MWEKKNSPVFYSCDVCPVVGSPRVVDSTQKKGKAHCCLVQGKVTTTAIKIKRSPGLLTECLLLYKALSQ